MFTGTPVTANIVLTSLCEGSILGLSPPDAPLMYSKSRYSRLFEMLSPEQRAQLGLVQDALQEDPTCLEKKEQELEEEKDA
ncbi:MAG TPA: hypothetical protein VIY48_00320 [Candidatus Paceibacterota bacterium]